jgi:N-acetylglucosamine-6-phosphate deacetylase
VKHAINLFPNEYAMIRHVHSDGASSGQAAARIAAKALRASILEFGRGSLLVATGTSQLDVLSALVLDTTIAWQNVDLFHLDEYIGLDADHPASFRRYLRERFVQRLPQPLRSFLEIRGEANPELECKRLEQSLPQGPFDVAILGIGENGHLAFNDPPADFNTTIPFLIVELDQACRSQQVAEGWYPSLEAVPKTAITMSLCRILQSRRIVCVVPEKRKAAAVRDAIEGALSPLVPATILRLHPHVDLFLDDDSASLLFKGPGDAVDDLRLGCREDSQSLGSSPPIPLDLQLNGYHGIDFNADQLDVVTVRQGCELVRRDSGGHFLATVISDDVNRMIQRIDRLAEAYESDEQIREILCGIHIEGPFLLPENGYRGTHPQEHLRPATMELAKRLVDAGRGLVRLMTLAPEQDEGLRTIQWLARNNVVVSAGHCNPSADLLQRSVDAGVSLFTHLGNGCPQQLPRHDNIIQRVLACTGLSFVTFIADDVHIPLSVLKNYIRLVGLERCILVTDGTSAAGMGPGRYELAGQTVIIGDDGAAWAPDRSHLMGSAITMQEMRQKLSKALDLSPSEIDEITCINPRRAVGFPVPTAV